MKKLINLLLVTTLIFSTTISVSAKGYSDVEREDWFYPYITALTEKDIIKGTPDGTYEPNKELYADELLALVLRTMGKEQPNGTAYWADNYINAALELNLIDQGEFAKYDAPISRGKIAKIIVRSMANETYGDFSEVRNVLTDVDTTDETDYILKAAYMGIITGYSDKTFRASNNATKAEAATMTMRMVDPEYRSKLYGNVWFSTKTDVDLSDSRGDLTKGKVIDFCDELLKSIRIYDNNGKVAVKGNVPELPDGYEYSLNIEFYDRQNNRVEIEKVRSASSIIAKNRISEVGAFNIDLDLTTNQVGLIRINSGVDSTLYSSLYSVFADKSYVNEWKESEHTREYPEMFGW